MDPRARYRTFAGRHGKRLPKSFYWRGYPVHVVVCAFDRSPVFLRRHLAEGVFAIVDRHPETLAACLMPDHLHWLLAGEGDFSRVVQRFKSYSTRLAWRLGHPGRLWQRSFYDHVVRNDEAVSTVAAYIVENPVRAGLVGEWREYPWACVHIQCSGRHPESDGPSRL